MPTQPDEPHLPAQYAALARVPDPLAVAAYDAIWSLRAVINQQGINPDAIREGLLGSTPRTLVQGTLHPVDYGNGDLIRQAMVYELGPYGGATVLARFDDTQRLPLEDAGDEVPVAPTPTPGPPTSTPFPTATLQGTWLRVTANVLNVRSGPGFNYDRIGQVEEGDLLRVMGSIPDYSWMLVDFRGGVGWVKTEYAELTGSLADVPINVAIPPTPTVGATLPPTLPPNPDIVIDTVVLQPSQPIPNQPFTATVTVRNASGGPVRDCGDIPAGRGVHLHACRRAGCRAVGPGAAQRDAHRHGRVPGGRGGRPQPGSPGTEREQQRL